MSIRLGDIQFLNSWPVTYALRQGRAGPSGIVTVSGTPADLNRRLLAGELDASAVSSAMYLKHQDELIPIPALCIRSDGGVKSVLVVSRQPLSALKGKTVGISNQGATTPILLKLLLRERGLRFIPEQTTLRYPEILKQYAAALLIGDEALEAVQEEGMMSWDLGEAWTQWTRLPFVFALWVVRRSLAQGNPEVLEQVAGALRDSYQWSTNHPVALVAAMRKVFPWETTFLIRYLSRLSYDLDEKAWAGLKRFAREAEEIGELPKGTVRKMLKDSVRGERVEPRLVFA